MIEAIVNFFKSLFSGKKTVNKPVVTPVAVASDKTTVEPVVTPVELKKDKSVLDESDFQMAADILGVEVAVIKAIQKVESSGKAFLAPGKPQILFEGHVFWSQLKKAGFNPSDIVKKNPELKTVLYSKWTKEYYKGGIKEYERLDLAKSIDISSALASASWGLFQIMGMNYSVCGYDSVEAFVDAMCDSAYKQLEAFCSFCKGNNLVKYMVNKNWTGFAKKYNGSGYAQNKYDEKLAKAYLKYIDNGQN